MDDKNLAIATGKRIRSFRVEHNWTLNELVQVSGVPKSTLFAAEHGTAFATVITLQKLAAAFGVTPADLVNDGAEDAGVLMETMRQQPEMVAVIGEQAKEIKERCERETVEPSTAP